MTVFNYLRRIKGKKMKLEDRISQRSGNKCELCGSDKNCSLYEVPPAEGKTDENSFLICNTCLAQVEKKAELDNNHWACLNTSMWSEVPGVQVVSWRMLNRLRNETWAAEQLDLMYMDEERLAWAKATGDHESDGSVLLHRDAYGQLLQNGDTVITTKALDIKGSSLNAKMGTVVKNIRLVNDNPEQVEGKIEGQMIVILTKYLRKQQA